MANADVLFGDVGVLMRGLRLSDSVPEAVLSRRKEQIKMENETNKNYSGIWNAVGVLLLFAPIAVFWGKQAPKPEIDKNVSFVQAIEDHRLARSHIGYLHDGKTAFRRASTLVTEMDGNPVAVWFRKDELASLESPTFWQKIKCRCALFFNVFSFDEHGAYVFMKDRASRTLPKGCYVYLGSIRVEIDTKVAGTYIYEFPFYMDNAIIGSNRTELLAGFQDSVLSDICKTVHEMVSPEKSYRVTEVANGVVLTERYAKFTFTVQKNESNFRGV